MRLPHLGCVSQSINAKPCGIGFPWSDQGLICPDKHR